MQVSKEEQSDVMYQRFPDVQTIVIQEESHRSKFSKRRLHRKFLPCCDPLTDRIFSPLLPISVWILMLMDVCAFFLCSWIASFDDEASKELFSCLAKSVGFFFGGSVLQVQPQLAGVLFIKVLFYLIFLSLNSFPIESRRRMGKISVCRIFSLFILICCAICSLISETTFLLLGSICFARYYILGIYTKETGINWNDIHDRIVDFIDKMNITTSETSWKMVDQPSLSFKNSTGLNLVNLEAFSSSILTHLEVEEVGAYRPVNSRMFWYALLKVWLVMKFIAMSLFIIFGIFTLICLVTYYCCGLDFSYERFRRWRHKSYTKKLLTFQKEKSSDLRTSLIDSSEIDSLSKTNEIELLDENEYQKSLQSSTPRVESAGIVGFLKGKIENSKSKSKPQKNVELILNGHKIGFFDILPPLRLIQAHIGGFFIILFLLTFISTVISNVSTTLSDMMGLTISIACSSENLFCNFLGLLKIFVDLIMFALIITTILTPISSVTIGILSCINIRSNIIFHRKGLAHKSDVSKRNYSLGHGSRFIYAQASHYAIGFTIQFLIMLFLFYIGAIIGVLSVIAILAFINLIRNNAAHGEKLFLGVLQIIATNIIPMVLSTIITAIMKKIWDLNVIDETKFKNLYLYNIYDILMIPTFLVVSPVISFFKSLVFKVVFDIMTFQRIDYVTSNSFDIFKGFFFQEVFYGSPILNTFVTNLYCDCIEMETESQDNQIQEERMRKRMRMTKFLLGALLASNPELIARRVQKRMR